MRRISPKERISTLSQAWKISKLPRVEWVWVVKEATSVVEKCNKTLLEAHLKRFGWRRWIGMEGLPEAARTRETARWIAEAFYPGQTPHGYVRRVPGDIFEIFCDPDPYSAVRWDLENLLQGVAATPRPRRRDRVLAHLRRWRWTA